MNNTMSNQISIANKVFFLLSIIIILNFIHCPILNKFYTKPNRVRGTEAKQILQERLSSFYIKDISDSNQESLAADFLMPTIAKIQDEGIYSRRDVENCASRIFLIGIAIDAPSISYNRTKKASDPIRGSDPQSRTIPPLFCEIKNIDGWIDLE
jgi:small lipoprotein (TIGR04452 family)